jgi:hypothetical protein
MVNHSFKHPCISLETYDKMSVFVDYHVKMIDEDERRQLMISS